MPAAQRGRSFRHYLFKTLFLLAFVGLVALIHLGQREFEPTTSKRTLSSVDQRAAVLYGFQQPVMHNNQSFASSMITEAALYHQENARRSHQNGGDVDEDEDDEECNVHKEGIADVCEYIMNDPKCESTKENKFFLLRYCTLTGWWQIIFYAIAISTTVLLFYLLGNTIEEYFVPSLTQISGYLRLPPSIAGVTLLAVGTGSPDISASIVGAIQGSADFALAEPLGAGLYITTFVMGIVAMAADCKVKPPFIRDVLFYAFSTAYLLAHYLIGWITTWQALFFYVIYIVYVSSVIISRIVRQRLNKKRRLARMAPRTSKKISTTQHQQMPTLRPLSESASDSTTDHSPDARSTDAMIDHSTEDESWKGGWHVGSAPTESGLKESLIISEESPDLIAEEDSAQDWDFLEDSYFVPKLGILTHIDEHYFNETKEANSSESEQEKKSNTKSNTAGGAATDENEPMEGQRIFSGGLSLFSAEALKQMRQRPKSTAGTALVIPNSAPPSDAGPVDIELETSGGIIMDYFDTPTASKNAGIYSKMENEGAYKETFGEKLNRWKKQMWHKFLHDIEWRHKTLLGKIKFVLIDWLLLLIRNLTIPRANPREWNKLFAMLTPVCGIPFAYFSFVSSADFVSFFTPGTGIFWVIEMFGVSIPIFPIVFAIGCVLGLLILFTSRMGHAPFYFPVFVFVCFFMSIVWIYAIANNLLSVLSAAGVSIGLPEVLLATTVLCWGNAIGDIVADVIIARQGFSEMAVGAIYAGPMSNLLLGLGSSVVITSLKSGVFCYSFGRNNPVVLITIAFLIVTLLMSVVVVPVFRFKFSKIYGVFLFITYGGYVVVVVVYIFFLRKIDSVRLFLEWPARCCPGTC